MAALTLCRGTVPTCRRVARSANSVFSPFNVYIPVRSKCGRDEGVQGVLTLFGRGKAQVCHDLRVEELREQLEVGDRQEEKVEEKGEVESRRVRHVDDHGWSVKALRT